MAEGALHEFWDATARTASITWNREAARDLLLQWQQKFKRVSSLRGFAVRMGLDINGGVGNTHRFTLI